MKITEMNYTKILSQETKYKMTDLFGREPENNTYISFSYDENSLCVCFTAYFSKPLPQKYKRKTGKVYRSDCVELFLAFEKESSDYYELDVSPFNKTFFAKIKNLDDVNVQVFPWKEKQIVTNSQVFDDYYEVVYTIPLWAFPEYKGDIYLNAYRVEMQKSKRISRSLFPTYSLSHHIKKSFKRLIFKDKLL